MLSIEAVELVDGWIRAHSPALKVILGVSRATRSSTDASHPHLVREIVNLVSRKLDEANSAVIRGLLVRAGLSDRTDLEPRLTRAARDPEWLRWLCSVSNPEELAKELQKSR